MIVKFGTYELEFDDKIAELFEQHVYDTIRESALAYVSARAKTEDIEVICEKYSKEEIHNFIMDGVREDLRLCQVEVVHERQ